MARIYLTTLLLQGACAQQRRLFYKTFGLSAEINKENMKTAMKAGLSVRSADLYGRMGFERRLALREQMQRLYSSAYKELLTEGYDYRWSSGRWEKV